MLTCTCLFYCGQPITTKMASIGGTRQLPMLIFIAGILSNSHTSGSSCEFNGPNLNCVGFTLSPFEGDCFCRVPDSRTLEYGECMELTVEVSNTSSALSCKWFANMVEQVGNDPRFFFKVGGDKNQTLTFRREFSSFYFTSEITFNCTDGGSHSSVVYRLNELFRNPVKCKEYKFQQTPYIVSPREQQVNVTAAAGAPLTLGPIVVKNLDVDIIFANGSWCQYVGGDVKCCPFDMELSLDRNGTVSTIPCVGEMEEWSLLRALDCENGFVEYRLFKRDVRTSDSGEYVYTIANRYHTFNSTTVVDVFPTAAAPSPLTLEVGVIIAVVVTFLICFAVFLIILVGCVVGLWRRRAERGQEQLLQEEVAQQGVVREPVQGAANNGADDQARRLTNTFDSVFLDLGGSTVSRVV